MKIAIVGDPHISTGFRARVDDYLRTVLRKIKDIAKDNDYVIFLGDVFDTSAMPTYVFNETYAALREYEGKLHTILGNHDLFHRNLKALNRTTIGSLNITNVLHVHTEPFTLAGVTFVPVMTDDKVENIPNGENDSKKILLCHKYYDMLTTPEESLTREDFVNLDYSTVFMGHDHMPYEPLLVNNSTIYRPGSLTRTTVDVYNKDRGIRYYQLDTETMVIDEVPVFCQSSDDVFLRGSFDKPKDKVIKTDKSTLAKLLARFDKKTTNSLSLNDTLVKLGGTKEEVQYLRELHTMHNIKYN